MPDKPDYYKALGVGKNASDAEIKKHIPEFTCEFVPDSRQKIADSWPESVDDSVARKDWGWKPKYNLAAMTKDMIKAASAIEARCVQFSGLTSKLEGKADELSGKIEQITKNLSGVPDRMLSTEQINLNRRMNKTVTKLFEDIGLLHKQTKQCAKFAAGAMKAVKTLKAKDSWLGTTETAGGVGSKGVAIYALANFCLACADHGKQLISLLPV